MDMMAYSFKWGQIEIVMITGGLNCNLIYNDLAKGIWVLILNLSIYMCVLVLEW